MVTLLPIPVIMYQYLFYVDSILRKKTVALSLSCFIQNSEVYSFDVKKATTTTTTSCDNNNNNNNNNILRQQ